MSLPAPDAPNAGHLYHLLNGNASTNTGTGPFRDAGTTATLPSLTLNNTSGGKGLTVQSDGTQWLVDYCPQLRAAGGAQAQH